MVYHETENGNLCPPTGQAQILIADDEPIVRYALKHLLNLQEEFFVVGEAANYAECWFKMVELNPDLVILDLQLSGISGTEFIDKLRKFKARTRVIVFTFCLDDVWVAEAIKAGVNGYLTKTLGPDALVAAVRSISHGDSYLDPLITSKVMGLVGRNNDRRGANSRVLTSREKQTLILLAQGKRNKEIAEILCVSERTVKHHVSGLLRKLLASNRTEAVKFAFEQRLI